MPSPAIWTALAVALVLVYYTYAKAKDPPVLHQFPVVALDERGLSPKQSWRQASDETIAKGLKEYTGPFQIITGTGPKLIFPNRFADQLRYRRELDPIKALSRQFPIDYPGFEAFRIELDCPTIINDTVRGKLNRSLDAITHELADEANVAIAEAFGSQKEWHSTILKENILNILTRMSSRVFVGPELCRDKSWINTATGYTVDSFIAAYFLRFVPHLLRPLAYWLNPYAYKVRAHVRNARRLINPVAERYRSEIREHAQSLTSGRPKQRLDALAWMHEVRDSSPNKMTVEVDFAVGQLALTLASVHTTSEALATAIADLCQHPTVIDELRKEIIEVVSVYGWSKTAIQKLARMDSFLKESQRFHPPALVTMQRYVEQDFELSGGVQVPAGSVIAVACAFSNLDIYDDPSTFKPFRFYYEESEKRKDWAHVSVQPAHMAFGLGKHACPGRFFASHEMKIALCHLVMKYEWKLVPDSTPLFSLFEAMSVLDPKRQVLIQRRDAEICLNTLDELR